MRRARDALRYVEHKSISLKINRWANYCKSIVAGGLKQIPLCERADAIPLPLPGPGLPDLKHNGHPATIIIKDYSWHDFLEGT